MRHFTRFWIGIFCLLNPILLFSKPVSEQKAKQIGLHFLMSQPYFSSANTILLKTAYTATSKATFLEKNANSKVFYYIFELEQQPGFVIVAADDVVEPILGYSYESHFPKGEPVAQVAKWLEDYRTQIRLAIEHSDYEAKQANEGWKMYEKANPFNIAGGRISTVNPLCAAKWDQGNFYNALCPFDAQSNQRTVTGCVATAMAIIMKKWNAPAQGQGFYSYNHQRYGTLSAQFGSTQYNWSAMPNVVNSQNNAVATLMYHCGVSVEMDYGVAATGGSSAYIINAASPIVHCSEHALKTYFGYKTSMQGLRRVNFTQTNWINRLKTELDAGRPVLYAGFGSGGGHAFVCDGYDNNNFFHFNWGWSGQFDGFFNINALNPDGVGTGGGTGGFNSGHQALVGIEPIQQGGGGGTPAPGAFNIQILKPLQLSANIIGYNNPFSVTTNVINAGANTFNGDFTLAIFDNQNNLVEVLDTISVSGMQQNFQFINDVTFSSTGSLSMLPGNYVMALFYRPVGGNWVIVADAPGIQNLATISVVNNNPIRLGAAVNISSGNSITQGSSFTVTTRVNNSSGTNFSGLIDVSFFDLDGKYTNVYADISGINLAPGATSGNLTFNFQNLPLQPGTYLLVVFHKRNTGDYELTGTGSFQNPIRVTVQSAAINPDAYEPNNTVATARSFNLNFSNNQADVYTFGSNLHVGNDVDHYRITIPGGATHTCLARLHDSYNSGNGASYTVDALFSYSLNNGQTWSDSYDDIMPGTFTAPGGSSVIFKVAPFFSGHTGTYQLDISVSSSGAIQVKDLLLANEIMIYPNPANDQIFIKQGKYALQTESVEILDITGRSISKIDCKPSEQDILVSLPALKAGIYQIKVNAGKSFTIKKLIVK